VTSANLKVVQSIYADWERGDYRSVEWADPDIEFVIDDGISSSAHAGVRAMSEAWREFLLQWEDWRTEVEEYRELDAERVLVLLRVNGRGKRSGVDVGQVMQRGANLFHLRGGVVRRLCIYLDSNRAPPELGVVSTERSPPGNG
jgi:ketosteroid isomerase-like protein